MLKFAAHNKEEVKHYLNGHTLKPVIIRELTLSGVKVFIILELSTFFEYIEVNESQ